MVVLQGVLTLSVGVFVYHVVCIGLVGIILEVRPSYKSLNMHCSQNLKVSLTYQSTASKYGFSSFEELYRTLINSC